MTTKKPWQSKTILINGIMGLAAFAAVFWPNASSVTQYIAAHGAEIALGWSVLNTVLRLITKDKIVLTD